MNIKSVYGNYLRLNKEIVKIETLEEFRIFRETNIGVVYFNDTETDLIDINPLFIGKFSNTMMKLTDERGVYNVGDYFQYFSENNIIQFKSDKNFITKRELDSLEVEGEGDNPLNDVYVMPFKTIQTEDNSEISLRFIDYARCEGEFDPPGWLCLPRKGIGYIAPVFFFLHSMFFLKFGIL